MVQPDWFFISQIFSLGKSDLSDLELVYMTPMEGVIFFMFEGMYLPLIWIPACFFLTFFGWLYAAEIAWSMVDIFIFLLAGGEALYEMDAETYYNEDEKMKGDTISFIVDATFKEYDKNGDGFLDKEESKDFA